VKRLEKDIQSEVTLEATYLGLIPIRINVVGRKGWPDYGYLYYGRICFIEFKRPGEKPEPLQLHVHGVLNRALAQTFIVDNADYGKTILKEWKRGVDTELARLRQSDNRDA
jgi:hypothetical protein